MDQAARMFPGTRAVVLTVWTSVHETARAARLALPDDVIEDAAHTLDAAADEAARATARAEPNVVSTILRTADEQDAICVVVGSRGISRLRSALLGSVSNAVVHQCRRPVLVIHDSDLEHDGGAHA